MLDNKNARRRQDSNEKFMDALQDNFSKICVVRVDLGYRKDETEEVTLEKANNDINRLLNNRRNNSIFDDNIAYLLKIENGEDKDVHVHSFFFYDGQKVQKDSIKGEAIGKYWTKKITNGKGNYYNCNRNDYKDNHAIGMLDYRNVEKRRNLDNAMAYLAKEEQSIDLLKSNEKNRAIRRSTIPKSKGNMGRPRKESKE